MIGKILGVALTLTVFGIIFGVVLLVFISLSAINDKIMNDNPDENETEKTQVQNSNE